MQFLRTHLKNRTIFLLIVSLVFGLTISLSTFALYAQEETEDLESTQTQEEKIEDAKITQDDNDNEHPSTTEKEEEIAPGVQPTGGAAPFDYTGQMGTLYVNVQAFPLEGGRSPSSPILYGTGVTLSLHRMENGTEVLVDTTVTDSEGNASFGGLYPDDKANGIYILRQVTPFGAYRMDTTAYTIRVTDEEFRDSVADEQNLRMSVDEYSTYGAGDSPFKSPLVLFNLTDPELTKYIDETEEEIISANGEAFTYYINAKLPGDVYYYGIIQYSSFEIIDDLDERLEVTGPPEVYFRGSVFSSSYWSYTKVGNKVTVSVQPDRLRNNMLNSYDCELQVRIPVKVKEDAEFVDTIYNTAHLHYVDSKGYEGEPPTNEVRADPDLTTVTVEKIWIGGPENRPEIEIDLLQNGSLYDTTTIYDGEETFTWTALPVADENGDEYIYTVSEPVVPDKYTSNVDGFTITNTWVPNTLDIGMNKVWIGGPEEKPDITILLYRDGIEQDRIVLSNGETNYTWYGLPAHDEYDNYYSYTIDELDEPAQYEKHVNDYTVVNIHEDSRIIEPPVDPVDPTDPTDPTTPVIPVDPADPAARVGNDPANPANPSGRTGRSAGSRTSGSSSGLSAAASSDGAMNTSPGSKTEDRPIALIAGIALGGVGITLFLLLFRRKKIKG